MSRIQFGMANVRFPRAVPPFKKVFGIDGFPSFQNTSTRMMMGGGGGKGKGLHIIERLNRLKGNFYVDENLDFFRPWNPRALDIVGMKDEFMAVKEMLLKKLNVKPFEKMKVWEAAYRILLENNFYGEVDLNFGLTLENNLTLDQLKHIGAVKAGTTEKLLIYFLLNMESKLKLDILNYIGLKPEAQKDMRKEYGIYSIAFVEKKHLRDAWLGFQESLIDEDKIEFSPGDKIGKFKIEKKIGEGGKGIVYKAMIRPELKPDYSHWSRKPLALKFLKPEYAGQQKERMRLVLEGQACRFTQNKLGIVETFEIPIYFLIKNGKIKDINHFIASEFVDGESLSAKIKNSSDKCLPITTAIFICIKICHALNDGHKHGVFNLDLKPENIFLVLHDSQEMDIVKILDFGTARIRGLSTFSHDLEVWGTPPYVSPEHFMRETVDGRADIYSLGVILYEMIMGEVPLKDINLYTCTQEADIIIAPLKKYLLEEYGNHSYKNGINYFLKIIQKMLERDINKRYEYIDVVKYHLLASISSMDGWNNYTMYNEIVGELNLWR